MVWILLQANILPWLYTWGRLRAAPKKRFSCQRALGSIDRTAKVVGLTVAGPRICVKWSSVSLPIDNELLTQPPLSDPRDQVSVDA